MLASRLRPLSGCVQRSVTTVQRQSHSRFTTSARTRNAQSDVTKAPKKRERNVDAAAAASATTNVKKSTSPVAIGILVSCAALAGVTYDIRTNPTGALANWYYDSYLYEMWQSFHSIASQPTVEQLLPDFVEGPIYGKMPLMSPPPPVLVIDVEKTLVGSVHDGTHGWRHVKRPGVDEFLSSMSRYYEIILLSDNDSALMEPVFMALDPNGSCHKFGVTASEIRGEQVLKRIDLINRPHSRVLFLDDNAEAVSMCERNALIVKPFENVADRSDRTLTELIPLLQALVHENIPDFRELFDSFGTRDAHEVSVEYKMRVEKKMKENEAARNRGLGSLIRGKKEVEADRVRSSVLSVSSIVGVDHNVMMSANEAGGSLNANAPRTDAQKAVASVGGVYRPTNDGPVRRKRGAFFDKLNQYEESKGQDEVARREAINNAYGARQAKNMAKNQKTTEEEDEGY